MFTSSPSLAQRIERMIGETAIVDPHTHLHQDHPAAPDLASLMSYHWVQTELKSVGMPAADLDASLPPEERVKLGFPLLNVAASKPEVWSWRLAREVLRDALAMARCDALLHAVSNVSTAAAYINPQLRLVYCA